MKEKRIKRFGIIVDRFYIEDWQMECILALQTIEGLEFTAIVDMAATSKTRSQPSGKRPRIMESGSILGEWADVQVINSELPGDAAAELANLNVNFMLAFTSQPLPEEISSAAAYGVWAFRFGKGMWGSAGSACFWAMYQNDPAVEGYLIKLESNNAKPVLRNGVFPITRHSLKKTRGGLLHSVSSWPALAVRDINQNGFAFQAVTVNSLVLPQTEPALLQRFLFQGQLVMEKVRKVYEKIFRYEYWNVGIIHKPIHHVLTEQATDVEWVVNKEKRYYADPFGYVDEKGLHLMMEEVDPKIVKGYLTEMNVTSEMVNIHKSVIQLPFHLSYPYLLSDNGSLYCIPESSAAREVRMYKHDQLSGEWEYAATLLKDIAALDSTVFKYGDYWWLFCTNAGKGSLSELSIFYAEQLSGPWTPHLLNPVKFDIRSSRPAGTPFIYGGNLYRPAQDCSRTYGGRISINQIKKLSPREFEEEIVCYVNPPKGSLYSDGTHTISAVGDMTVLDGKKVSYSPLNLLKKVYMAQSKLQDSFFKKRDEPIRHESEAGQSG